MAARKTKHLSNDWRLKIQTSMLLNRLGDHVNGKVELSPTQVNAANILLRKVLPDLAASTISGDPENPQKLVIEEHIVDHRPTDAKD